MQEIQYVRVPFRLVLFPKGSALMPDLREHRGVK